MIARLREAVKAKDLYAALSLPDGATHDEIRDAWRRIAAQYHPDKNEGVTSDIFLRAKHAHEILTDPDLKREYDQSGIEPAARLSVDKLAHGALQQLIDQILNSNADPDSNILTMLRISLEDDVTQTQSKIRQAEQKAKRFSKMESNLKQFWEGREDVKEMTLSMLELRLNANKAELQNLYLHLDISRRAIEIIKDCNYRLPVASQPTITRGQWMVFNP